MIDFTQTNKDLTSVSIGAPSIFFLLIIQLAVKVQLIRCRTVNVVRSSRSRLQLKLVVLQKKKICIGLTSIQLSVRPSARLFHTFCVICVDDFSLFFWLHLFFLACLCVSLCYFSFICNLMFLRAIFFFRRHTLEEKTRNLRTVGIDQ